jgi:hypothetical protein
MGTLSGGVTELLLPSGLSAGTHTITETYGGAANFNSSYGTQTPYVLEPLSAPEQPTCNCGCPNSPGSVAQPNTPGANSPQGTAPSTSPTRPIRRDPPFRNTSTTDPVRYVDGVVTIALTDLYSTDAGFPWAQTRSWTNGGYAASGVNGVGWVDTYTPQLIMADGASTDTLVLIQNGTDAEYFECISRVSTTRRR